MVHSLSACEAPVCNRRAKPAAHNTELNARGGSPVTVRTASRSMHDGVSSTRAAVHRVRATEPSLSYPSPQSTAVARHVGFARRVIVSLVGISACHGQRKRCRLRFDADELRRDGCHRKPPHAQLYAHWAPLTSTLVPRSLSEVRWRRQGSGSTSHGPRSAHCRADALCADLFKVLPDLHRRDQMTAERRPARARSIRATVPRAAWLEQVPLRRTGRLSPV